MERWENSVLTPSEFLDSYCEIGYKKARSPAGRILLLAILAGILIGMGAVVSNTSSHALELSLIHISEPTRH